MMPDREKVLKGLECLADLDSVCRYDCSYLESRECGHSCFENVARDALTLLKEQEAVKHAKDINVPGKWTSVKDRLPEEKKNLFTNDYQEVICCCDFGEYGRDIRAYEYGQGHFWHGPHIMDRIVTHWMPLPEPPREVQDA